jgi:hypothetical protein
MYSELLLDGRADRAGGLDPKSVLEVHVIVRKVSVAYELHESNGKTSSARRCLDLDSTTLDVLTGWRARLELGAMARGPETSRHRISR